MTEGGHVSTFELDVHWAAGRPEGEVEAHIVRCGPCKSYLASLEELQAAPEKAPPKVTPLAPKRSWAFPAGGVLALAAAIFLYVHAASGPPREAPYVATKGTPAVELLVEREQKLLRWSESVPVHPMDRLALRVACEDFAHVTVAAAAARNGWTRVYDNVCPAGTEPLPFSLVVDQEPGDEHLAVVLSKTALDDASLAHAIAAALRGQDAWTVKLDLVKVDPAR